MSACFCIGDGDLGDPGSRRFGIDSRHARVCRVLVGRQDSAVAVRGVLAKAHIDGQKQGREELCQELKSLNDGGVWIVCGAASSILISGQTL